MPDEVATKTCTGCKKVIFKALFPSLKHAECKDCHNERMRKYRPKFRGISGPKGGNSRLFRKKPSDFEWEKHIDLQENN